MTEYWAPFLLLGREVKHNSCPWQEASSPSEQQLPHPIMPSSGALDLASNLPWFLTLIQSELRPFPLVPGLNICPLRLLSPCTSLQKPRHPDLAPHYSWEILSALGTWRSSTRPGGSWSHLYNPFFRPGMLLPDTQMQAEPENVTWSSQ